MNKIILASAAAAGLVTEMAVHGYMDVMAKPMKVQSVISYFANKANDKNMEAFHKFTQTKLEWVNKQNTENVSITSQRGELLKGYLTMPEKRSRVFVFFAHGYRADHNGDPANFMRYYVEEKGFNFLSVDHVASGASGGNWVGFDYFEHQDSLDWIDYLISRFGKKIKIIIHGVSMGASTICQMVNKVPKQVVFAVADCPYTSALDEFEYVANSVGVKNTKNLLNIFNAMNRKFAGFDLKETDVRRAVMNSRVPMLFVHGKEDTFVPKKMGSELFNLCPRDKELFLVNYAGHAQSIMYDEIEYHNRLSKWIKKYLRR